MVVALLASGAVSAGNRYKSRMYEKGYGADIQISGAFDTYSKQGVLSTSHGYRFGNGLYVGGGIGFGVDQWDVNENKNRFLVQYFADIKYSFTDRLASPFVTLRAGGMYDYANVGAGYMLRPAVGVDIWRFSLTVGYDFQSLKYYNGQARAGQHYYNTMPVDGIYVGLSYNF